MSHLDDPQIGWKTKKLYLPSEQFNSVSPVDGVSLVVGGQFAQVAATNLGGVEQDAADGIAHFMRIPWDLDVTQEVHARVHFLSDSVGTDTVDLDMTYKFFAIGAALAVASGDGTVAWDQITMTSTQYLLTATDWLPMGWTTNYASGDYFIGLQILTTAWAGTADELFLMGLELEYTVDAATDQRKTT